MGKTSTKSRDKYNERVYARYTVRIRKDTELYEKVEQFMAKSGTSLNHVVNKLLSDFFSLDDEER